MIYNINYNSFRQLISELQKIGIAKLTTLELSNYATDVSSNEIERIVCDSVLLVFLISEQSLTVRSFISAMEFSKAYQFSVAVTLVHCWSHDFPFPSVAEQPNTVQDFFLDKCITLVDGKCKIKSNDH